MTLLSRVKAANRPGVPEHSIVLRVAATASVAIGIAACGAEGELSATVAGLSVAALVVGSLFSYHRRTRPQPWVKLLLAVVAMLAFWHFFFSLSGPGGVSDLGAVEGPLAMLFTWIQVAHSFDVPSRRDLAFSLAGSVTLMAVAAAQALDMSFALYVVAWAACGLVGLGAMWGSISGAGRPPLRSLTLGAGFVVAVALICLLVLPAPAVSSRLVFPSSLAGDVPIVSPAGLEGTPAGATLPARAGSPSGRIAMGGFLGFAGPLNTALRGTFGDQLIFRVRAQRPSFFVAETFDHFDGQSWTETTAGTQPWRAVPGPSPFTLTNPPSPGARPDIQTFYLAQAGPNLVFHAQGAEQVWFPASRLYIDGDGNIRASTSMGPGSIYTVVSDVSTPSAAQLKRASGPPLDQVEMARYTQLPHPYPKVAALAERISAKAPSTEAKVLALEAWLGHHTHYTTDIPPLPKGADTVDEFLFGNRRGYCEQISTSLAVMLRTLNIPVRETTGYVPGPFNPITDLYDVQARDAHAWVQVWMPGYGWQSFDPTASVPLANPSPAATLAHDLVKALEAGPLLMMALVGAFGGLVTLLWRRRTRRPASVGALVSAKLVSTARRAGLEPRPFESLSTLGARIDGQWPPKPGEPTAAAIARLAEAEAFGGRELTPMLSARLVEDARALSRRIRAPASKCWDLKALLSRMSLPRPGQRMRLRPAKVDKT